MSKNVYLESKPRYEILDGLRGVASLMVIVFHLGETYCTPGEQQWMNHGYLAVDFFFALSGFVIGYAYDDRWGKMSLGGFFKRRLTRLHPMVVIANIIGACLFFFGASYFTASLEIPFWKFALCFIMGMFIIPCGRGLDIRGWNEMNSFNGPIWTLTFEYIGNILYALIFRHLPTFVLCILCAGAAVFTLDFTLGWDMFDILPYGPQYHVKGGWSLDPEQIYLGFTRLLYPFLCGLIISRVLPKYRTEANPSGSPIRLKGGFIWTSLILMTILSIPCIGGTDGVANGAYQAVMIILAFPIIILMGAGSTIQNPALAKICKFLGDISYPIYITHYPLIYLHMGFVAEHPEIPTWMHVASGVGIFIFAIILAWGLFKAFDEPSRKWLTDHWLKGEQKLPMWLKITAIGLAVAGIVIATYSPKWTETNTQNGYNIIVQDGGQTLGYSPESGVTILTEDRYAFKDLNKNGVIDPYEDWRLSAEERAEDLAGRLSIEEIAGLMLYSSHQSVPSSGGFMGGGTYNGKPFAESGALPSDLSDDQKKFLTEDNLRAVLVTTVQSPEVAAQWNNNMQALVEGLGHGVPVNTSSDPRHETSATAEYNYGAGGDISHWPTSLGLAATFDPALVEEFGQIASEEYRALGIATALSPQIDLATEPRWTRFYGTFGESPELDTDMARAYVDGFQTSYGDDEIAGGWGYKSVNAMVKHWPSGGPEEGGRDAHYNYGKYAVYPGGAFETHLKPFTEGAFKLNGATGKASAVMPYYTISTGIDPSGKNVGNSFSKYIITDLLREKYSYDGVVCTDWNITYDNLGIDKFDGKCWGVEEMTVAQRHYECLKAGVDQFGGNNKKGPVLEAYAMWVEEFGQESADARFRESAKRLLLNSFRTGLFENPYLDPAVSAEVVGNPEFMEKGYQAQLKSVVMVKNSDNVLPVKAGERKPKVYVPQRYFPELVNFFGHVTPERWEDAIATDLLEKYYEPVADPAEADFAIVMIDAPTSGTGYSAEDVRKGGNGYLPISLQYNDYTAEHAREVSIAGGDRLEASTNRSYKGKSVKTVNKSDLQTVIDTKKAMNGKPVITIVSTGKPFVPEFEPYSDAILVCFGCQNQALLDLISGAVEPSALLPMQLPVDMSTVELQMEDVPFDMECYIDADGNKYDFAYGLNWSGKISDSRTEKYAVR